MYKYNDCIRLDTSDNTWKTDYPKDSLPRHLAIFCTPSLSEVYEKNVPGKSVTKEDFEVKVGSIGYGGDFEHPILWHYIVIKSIKVENLRSCNQDHFRFTYTISFRICSKDFEDVIDHDILSEEASGGYCIRNFLNNVLGKLNEYVEDGNDIKLLDLKKIDDACKPCDGCYTDMQGPKLYWYNSDNNSCIAAHAEDIDTLEFTGIHRGERGACNRDYSDTEWDEITVKLRTYTYNELFGYKSHFTRYLKRFIEEYFHAKLYVSTEPYTLVLTYETKKERCYSACDSRKPFTPDSEKIIKDLRIAFIRSFDSKKCLYYTIQKFEPAKFEDL